MKFKGLESSEVLLRAMEPEDVEVLYKWENDTDNWNQGNSISPFSRYTLDEFIQSASYDILTTRQMRFIIISKIFNKLVGAVDLFEIDFINKRAGVGILIEKEFRRKSIASESLNIIANYANSVLNLDQLYCHIAEDNIASINLFTKLGFEKSGKLSKWLLSSGEWKDVFILQKLNFS